MSAKAKKNGKKEAPIKETKKSAAGAQSTKSAKAPQEETKIKKAKGKATEEEEAPPAEQPPGEGVDLEELEEQQEEAAAASSGQNSDAAALAAAANPSEMSASFKNFRHHPDMENFYRFIYENDLRHEALAIIETIMVEKQAKKQMGKPVRG